MSAPRYAVNQFDEIAKHLKGIEAETTERINSSPVEEAKEPPAIDDVYGMYGYPCGFALPARVVGIDGSAAVGRLTGVATGGTSVPLPGTANLPPYTPGGLTSYALVDGKWYFTFGGKNYVSDN